MKLKSLTLEDFRNYTELTLDLSKDDVIALIGDNAQGKTNILESIAFLALGKSFRTHRSIEALSWERPHGRIKGQVDKTHLEVFLERRGNNKKVKKDDKVVKPSEFLGNFRVVLFTPDTLQLISGSPARRRQFLDRVLIQLSPRYVEAFGNYQRTLKQRNALLKRIQSKQAQDWELDLWDAQLEHEAQKIWKARKELTEHIQAQIQANYSTISNTADELTLSYQPKTQRFDEQLLTHRQADIFTGSSSLGPHRDDFALKLNQHNIAETGSRGECRSAVLALKLAEIHFIEQKTKQKPLLLLDDVFSELDEHRQAQLGQSLQGYQCIITTTSKDHVKAFPNLKIYQVQNGQLSPQD